MDFAENLKNLLDMRDIQVKELSAETGISKNTLDNYLSGQKSIPNAENAIKIARCLGVSAEYLVTGKPACGKYPALPEPLLQKMAQLGKRDLAVITQVVNALAEKYC